MSGKPYHSNCIKPSFKVDANVKRFLSICCKENYEALSNGFSFKPSADLSDLYTFKEVDGVLCFSGIISISDTTLLKTLKELSIRFRNSNNELYVVNIPTSKTKAFFELKNANYFEISTKVALK